MSQKNMGRLAQDMKRELIAIIGRLTIWAYGKLCRSSMRRAA